MNLLFQSKTWFDALDLGRKLQLVIGATCLAILSLLAVLQTLHHFDRTESERRRANLRITEAIAGPLNTVLMVKDPSAIYGFMEIFDRDPMAAGLVIVKDNAVIKSQQSLDHPSLPTNALRVLALAAAKTGASTIEDLDGYQLVAVPIKDSAGRVLGSLAVGWNTINLLEAAWQDIAILLAGTLLTCGLLIVLLGAL